MKGYEIIYEHYKEYNRPEHYMIWIFALLTTCPYNFDSRFNIDNNKCELLYTDENFKKHINKDCISCWEKIWEEDY